MKKILNILGLSTFLVLMMNMAVAHAETGDFTIYPSYMHNDNKNWILLDIEQGETITDFVTVENLTPQQQTIDLEVLEIQEEDGAYLPVESAEPANLAAWTKLPQTKVELAPHEAKEVRVETTVPRDAETGEYKAAVLASKTEKTSQDLSIKTRIGVRMYVNVQSPSPWQANVFGSPFLNSAFFFFFSLFGLLAAVFYNVIHYLDNKKHAQKQA